MTAALSALAPASRHTAAALLACCAILPALCHADFLRTSDPQWYDEPSNWDSGNINDDFSRDLTDDLLLTWTTGTTTYTLPSLSITLDGNGSSLKFVGNWQSAAMTVTLSGNVTQTDPSLATKFGDADSGWKNFTTQLNSTRTFNIAGTWTQGKLAGNGGLTKSGDGTMLLDDPQNTYSGLTTVSDGTLRGQHITNQGVNSSFGHGNVSISNGGTMEVFGASFQSTNRTFTLSSGSGTISITGSGVGNLTMGGVVSGAGGLTKAGAGFLTLNATNTYSGSTTIAAGTLFVGTDVVSGSAGALGNATSAILLGDTTGSSDTTLRTSGAFTVGRAITVQSGNTGTATIGGNTAAASTYSGNINLGTASGTAKGVTMSAVPGGSVTFSGIINENTSVPASNVTIGNGGFYTGTIKLSNSGNGYSGATTVSKGAVLEVTEVDNGGNNSSIGNAVVAASNLVLSGGTLRYVGGGASSTDRLFTFDANGGTLDANAAVSFTGTGSLVASATGNRTLTLSGSANGALAGTIADPSSGTTAVTKSGAGTWTVSGANTYTGGTTINGGTLLASNTTGSATGTGQVTVNANGILSGAGTVSGAVVVNNQGTLAPGASIDTLDVGALTFNAGSTFSVEMDSSANFNAAADLVTSSGSFTIMTGDLLSIVNATPNQLAPFGTKFTLIAYTANTWNGGTFVGLPDDTEFHIGIHVYKFNYNDTTPGSNFGGGSGTGRNYVTITAVPEASPFIFGGLVCLSVAIFAGIRKIRITPRHKAVGRTILSAR